jgi:hypothetical protein
MNCVQHFVIRLKSFIKIFSLLGSFSVSQVSLWSNLTSFIYRDKYIVLPGGKYMKVGGSQYCSNLVSDAVNFINDVNTIYVLVMFGFFILSTILGFFLHFIYVIFKFRSPDNKKIEIVDKLRKLLEASCFVLVIPCVSCVRFYYGNCIDFNSEYSKFALNQTFFISSNVVFWFCYFISFYLAKQEKNKKVTLVIIGIDLIVFGLSITPIFLFFDYFQLAWNGYLLIVLAGDILGSFCSTSSKVVPGYD